MVFVVHATWQHDRLVLWAEDASAATMTTTSRAEARPHPFAAPISALSDELPRWGEAAAEAAGKGSTGELVLLLPGSARGPAPSPECGIPGSTRRPRMGNWRVPALFVEPSVALRLLRAVDEISQRPAEAFEPDESGSGSGDITAGGGGPHPAGGAPGPNPGPDLRYFAIVAGFVQNLVRGGRVLPQLVVENGGYAARAGGRC